MKRRVQHAQLHPELLRFFGGVSAEVDVAASGHTDFSQQPNLFKRLDSKVEKCCTKCPFLKGQLASAGMRPRDLTALAKHA